MNVPKTEQKQVFLKSYSQIVALAEALKIVRQLDLNQMSVSVIGNLGEDYINDDSGLTTATDELQLFFKGILGGSTDFDTFYNPRRFGKISWCLYHCFFIGYDSIWHRKLAT